MGSGRVISLPDRFMCVVSELFAIFRVVKQLGGNHMPWKVLTLNNVWHPTPPPTFVFFLGGSHPDCAVVSTPSCSPGYFFRGNLVLLEVTTLICCKITGRDPLRRFTQSSAGSLEPLLRGEEEERGDCKGWFTLTVWPTFIFKNGGRLLRLDLLRLCANWRKRWFFFFPWELKSMETLVSNKSRQGRDGDPGVVKP